MDNGDDADAQTIYSNLYMTEEDDPEDSRKRLKLKGQMMYMPDWDAVIFLGTPM